MPNPQNARATNYWCTSRAWVRYHRGQECPRHMGAISGGLHLTQTTIQETPFAVIRDKTQGPAIASGSFFAGTQAAQEIRTRGMQQMIVLQVTGGQRIN